MFKNPQSGTVSTDEKKIALEERKEALVSEITLLGEKVEEAGKIHKEYTDTVKDIDSLRTQKQTLLAEITDLHGVAELSKQNESLLAITNKTIIDKTEELKVILEMISDKTDEKENLEIQIDGLSGKKSSYTKEVEELKKELSSIESSISDKEKKISNSVEEKLLKVRELEEKITTLADSIKQIQENSVALKLAFKSKQEEYDLLTKSIEEAKVSLVDIESRKTEKNVAWEKELSEKKAVLDAREIALQTREGEASLMESSLAKKHQNLKDVKRQLEEFHGRSLPVNI